MDDHCILVLSIFLSKLCHFVNVKTMHITLHDMILHITFCIILYYYEIQVIRVCKVILIKSRGKLSHGSHVIEMVRNLQNRISSLLLMGAIFYYFFGCFFVYLTRRTRWIRSKQFFIVSSRDKRHPNRYPRFSTDPVFRSKMTEKCKKQGFA